MVACVCSAVVTACEAEAVCWACCAAAFSACCAARYEAGAKFFFLMLQDEDSSLISTCCAPPHPLLLLLLVGVLLLLPTVSPLAAFCAGVYTSEPLMSAAGACLTAPLAEAESLPAAAVAVGPTVAVCCAAVQLGEPMNLMLGLHTSSLSLPPVLEPSVLPGAPPVWSCVAAAGLAGGRAAGFAVAELSPGVGVSGPPGWLEVLCGLLGVELEELLLGKDLVASSQVAVTLPVGGW